MDPQQCHTAIMAAAIITMAGVVTTEAVVAGIEVEVIGTEVVATDIEAEAATSKQTCHLVMLIKPNNICSVA
jgi:hypothetical protein